MLPQDIASQSQTCIRCNERKPLAEFHSRGKSRPGQFFTYCKACAMARRDERGRSEEGARYRSKHQTEITERLAKWRQDHPERWSEIAAASKRRNREVQNAATARRYARMRGIGGSHTATEWLAIKARYDFRCLMCGRREPEIRLHRDHIIPVTRGGANTADNLQPLCKSCNSKKHTDILDLRPSYP